MTTRPCPGPHPNSRADARAQPQHLSRRGGNDPGFHRVILSDDGRQVTEVESYQMKRGCAFSWGHSFVESYAPHLDDGFNADKVAPPHTHAH